MKAPSFVVLPPLMHHGLVLPRRGREIPAPVAEGGNDLLGLPRRAKIPSGYCRCRAGPSMPSAAGSCAVRASLGRPCAVEAASFNPCSVPSRGSRRQLSAFAEYRKRPISPACGRRQTSGTSPWLTDTFFSLRWVAVSEVGSVPVVSTSIIKVSAIPWRDGRLRHRRKCGEGCFRWAGSKVKPDARPCR